MNFKNHRYILYFVSITILATITIQVYWNYINYRTNKTELVNQVQLSLDDAIESYYADIAREHVVTIITSDSLTHEPNKGIHKILKHINSDTVFEIMEDSLFQFETNYNGTKQKESFSFSYTTNDSAFNYSSDSVEVNMLASKIFMSINNDIIGAPKLAKLLEADFASKNWPINFGLVTKNNNCNGSIFCDSLQTFGITSKKNQLVISSRSAFLPPNTQLEIHFSNITSILLKKSLIGILLSLLLSAAIIFCLLYLFRVIKEQKQLAEIKDDLISNITHEFKTPITTVIAALEGIENFSGLNDADKTKKYISISNKQLEKLNTMVEKLLETASLDSNHLSLQLDKIDVINSINQQLEKFRINTNDKNFHFNHTASELICEIDVLHFESAIENLLDNAVKYGGDTITIHLNSNDSNMISIEIEDNGMGIAKHQQSKIFDKFYRVPTGNIHNVKGFGIGLYYTKNIIEKHGGSIVLQPNTSHTIFKITLPNGH